MKNKVIVDYLNYLLPNAVCELNYKKDYELLIATMLSAQTTDKRVNMVTSVLFSTYKDLKSLADASIEDIINIIRSVGTYNKKALNIKLIANALIPFGYVPNDRMFLENLPGVGRKTTNVVLSNIYNEQLIAVDTHVERVSKRLGIAKSNDDVRTVEKKLEKYFSLYDISKLHHQLVLFGRYYCQARKPGCLNCGLKEVCKYQKKTV